MTRVTIAEIARRSGVSKGAVSYVLNNRPGVSDATRARVLKVAEELQWVPNRAARILSGSRTDTFGLVVTRTASTLGHEPFYMEFMSGLESVLSTRDCALLLQVVPSPDAAAATYSRWWSERRVDGMVIVDVRVDDPRIPRLQADGVPSVVVADPSLAGGLTCVWTDDASGIREAVQHLVDLGHRRIARVAGLPDLGHVRIRDEALAAAAAEHRIEARIVHTDFSGDDGARATHDLLTGADPVTAIVYDNDLMAVAGLSVATGLGRRVPEDVSLVAWDDSALCRVTHPRITAVGHDVAAYGAAVAGRLFGLLEGEAPAAHLAATPTLRARGSSAPPALG
ncbi:DNA-binding LacI/PurR family transcriptional regulator [Kineococcus xinjiangensis]|uniref:DNA-binding LacI/PurR family transcriptional regulator n=1 Tax=Kineococcus xinjiangensis TaxID=512762 RepID=A0A2S6IUB3_9ACTN|nr:LacI family DNA-binding transcriptional regulator [Kineococcus xinjiangensis]PPK97862.1 DNA-binding LacI/PurR family transcriptional regulator [Kineococcus xinjiangensis]